MIATDDKRKTPRKTLLKIAYLSTIVPRQTEIAKLVNLSPSAVSRILQSDEAAKYLRIVPAEFRWDLVTAEERSELEGLDDDGRTSKQLTDLLGIGPEGKGPRVSVVSIAGGGTSPSAGLESFCTRIAPLVHQLLQRAGLIGVTWGRVVGHLCDSLAGYASPKGTQHATGPQVIPLCGESLGASNASSQSSSHLAERLQTILAAHSGHEFLSLGMIPVFFPGPSAFSADDLQSARKLLSYSIAYTKIFGVARNGAPSTHGTTDTPLADSLDGVLTSISREGNSFGFSERASFTWKQLKLAELEQMLIGDLGGVPLPRADLSKAQVRKFNELYERWTGLKEAHLRQCASRAFRADPSSGAPGVIVVGYGHERAKCVIEAVKRGLVNHLFVDGSLATALEREAVRVAR